MTVTTPIAPPRMVEMHAPQTEEELEERLSRPDEATVDDLKALDGDFLVLGAGGKMGFSMSRLLRRALDDGGRKSTKVAAVSRFGGGVPDEFERAGVETIAADLLDDTALAKVPDAPNVLFLAGMKFGSSGDLSGTWAL